MAAPNGSIDINKPRVLLLIPELQLGGAARVVRDHAEAFADQLDVHQAVFDLAYGVDFPGKPAVSLDAQFRSRRGFHRKLLNAASRVAALRRLKRELRIELSISHLEGAHYIDLLSRGEEKIVLCVHGSVIHNRLGGGPVGWIRKRLLIPILYNRADSIVTVSRDIIPELVSLGVRREKIRTINNFFDVSRISARAYEPLLEQETPIFEGAPVIATVGRLHIQKNPAPLLDMIAALKGARAIKLLFVGEGPMQAELVARSLALGLKTFDAWSGIPMSSDYDVYFVGKQENPFRFLRRAALFVLPSSWEGFPLALCEAMACEVPVIAADCPTGPREIIAPRTAFSPGSLRTAEHGQFGILMPMLSQPESYSSDLCIWTETIAALVDDMGERCRLAQAGKARVQDFSPQAIVPQWLELIDSLLVR